MLLAHLMRVRLEVVRSECIRVRKQETDIVDENIDRAKFGRCSFN